MKIYPAIDLMGGKCVRLKQGLAERPQYDDTILKLKEAVG